MSDQGGTKHRDLSSLRIDAGARRETGGKRRRWVWIGLIALGGLLLLAILAKAMGGAAKVEVAQARPGTGVEANTILNASGYVTPRRRATVAAKITGRVKEMLVDEGMQVEEGQVLALIDDTDARADYDAAKADRAVAVSSILELEVNLQDAERTLDRNGALLKNGFVDQQSVDRAQAQRDALSARLKNARAQVQAAQARMEVAQRQIENCTVRAPFAGIAVSKDAQPGEMVSPVSAGGGFTRTGISTIVDMTSLEIEVDVNESFIAKIAQGQKVEATLDAYPEWKIPASVRTVIPTADRQKATVKVRISFAQLDPRILPDMGVKVAFLQDAMRHEGPEPKALVPASSVREEGSEKAVYVLKDGRLERRPVTVGEQRNGDVEVLAGVAAGETVVTGGPDRLRDGQRAKTM